MVTGSNAWIEDELAGCRLGDERLERRLSTLLDQMSGAMGDSIPLACQDWANTKAAYRVFLQRPGERRGHPLRALRRDTSACRRDRRSHPGPSRYH
ncbi:transposase [Azospirillum sp. A26]